MQIDSLDFQRTMEAALGFKFAAFETLTSLNSVNIRAVREGDDFTFLVKLIPSYWPGSYERLVAHLKDMNGFLTMSRLFEKEAPARYKDWYVVCTSWCEGTNKTPDQLTEAEFSVFLKDYLAFLDVAKNATLVEPIYKVAEWRENALKRCHGLLGRLFKRYIDEAPAELCVYAEPKRRVVHGDLHPGNMRFSGGRLSAFLDIEGFVWAYPTWDILRFIVYSMMHTKFWEVRRRAKCLKRFAQAVRELPFDRADWIVAINADWIEQIDKKVWDRDPKWIDLPHLASRARLYRTLRQISASA